MNDLAARTLGLRVRAASTFGVARGTMRIGASVMIEKFAIMSGKVPSEFLDLNHTSKSMLLVSLMIPKFAREASGVLWRTSESGH